MEEVIHLSVVVGFINASPPIPTHFFIITSWFVLEHFEGHWNSSYFLMTTKNVKHFPANYLNDFKVMIK